MVGIPYVGKAPTLSNELVTPSYVQGLSLGNLDTSTVASLINTGFNPYVLKTYVDAQDTTLLANQAYVDAQDATRLQLSEINAVNGVAGLDAGGKVSVSRIPLTTGQRYPKPFISPSAYHATTVQGAGASTETGLFTMNVADPGFPYRLLLMGSIETTINSSSDQSLIVVRQGSITGQVVGYGAGAIDSIVGGEETYIGTPGNTYYTIPSWATIVDVVVVGGGAAGGAGGNFFNFINGQGGLPGNWNYVRLIRNVNLPSSTTDLLAVVPGYSGGWGGNTSVTGDGIADIVGVGGQGNYAPGNPQGGWPGTLVFNGRNYYGAQPVGGLGSWGQPPGGGGNGGAYAASATPNPGGLGASGGAWFFAAPDPPTPPRMQATILPWPVNAQSTITGSTTLYINLRDQFIGGDAGATTNRPKIMAIPVPA